ncbi:hypothetical protein [Acidovorax sp.]|uniref:hypothetical protein n=1 Tax=Acidovorax sp. TaxID=1872122 RepID=UPI002ACDF4D6|nr:hypothetical protein [Acidovorax sp.]MDZ7862637.1 hypothetical protein [Acidovorax sp.]
MSGGSYSPREGSVTWKVIQYLTTNPTEHLSAEVISAKFDCTRTNVHTLLAQAVQAELLKRTDDGEDGELVYRIGNGHSEIKPSAARAPSLAAALSPLDTAPDAAWRVQSTTPRAEALAAARAGRAAPAKPFYTDLSKVVIEKGVPLVNPKTKVSAMEWAALFNKMEVGDSFPLPTEGRHAIAHAMTTYHKTSDRKLVCRTVADGLRIWRKA